MSRCQESGTYVAFGVLRVGNRYPCIAVVIQHILCTKWYKELDKGSLPRIFLFSTGCVKLRKVNGNILLNLSGLLRFCIC